MTLGQATNWFSIVLRAVSHYGSNLCRKYFLALFTLYQIINATQKPSGISKTKRYFLLFSMTDQFCWY